MARTRPIPVPHPGLLSAWPRRSRSGPGRTVTTVTTVTTVGDLVAAACQAAGSPAGAARLLDQSSPLGHLLDRRIVIG